jgi:histidyl-tRNA synthetase
MTRTVEPRLVRGMRDLLPEQMLARQWMIDIIRNVYERYGFVPLSTPAIEYIDVLFGSAGEEAQKLIFTVNNPDFKNETPESERLGLRFDLTVPLARVVAQYPDLPKPFRRYQVAPVWRADKPDRGRFREFIQFDIDSVGVESEVADVEIIAAMCDTLDALGVGSYKVRFSSRKVLNLLLPFANIPEECALAVFRAIDKVDRIGMEALKSELTAESGPRLSESQVERIERFLAIPADKKRSEVIDQLRDLFANIPGAKQEIDVLERISRHLDSLGYHDDRVVIDLSVARGLTYYTGPVFEAVLQDAPEFGSVVGGGRYDELVMRFLGQPIPATGASIGVDRLLAALTKLGRIQSRPSTAQVLVLSIDDSMMDDYLSITYQLRRAGIPTELYLGSEKDIRKQLKYADLTRIPVAVIFGPDEKARGTVTIKDLETGRLHATQVESREEWLLKRPGQREVPYANLITEVIQTLQRTRSV